MSSDDFYDMATLGYTGVINFLFGSMFGGSIQIDYYGFAIIVLVFGMLFNVLLIKFEAI